MNELFKTIQVPKLVFDTTKFEKGQNIKLYLRHLTDLNNHIHIYPELNKEIICEIDHIAEESLGLKVIEYTLKEFRIQEYYHIIPEKIENGICKIELMKEE